MCGIFGAIHLSGTFDAHDRAKFEQLTNLVHYRGPNDGGCRTFTLKRNVPNDNGHFDVFLGNRRLAILDLSSSGHQPMGTPAGSWIAYNGEIFNYVELREELQKRGREFFTGTDTETILGVYEEFGEQAFWKLNGMWSFAIADQTRRRVVLSRDRFSIKPLYLLRTPDRLYFASEIKQLIPLLDHCEVDEEVMSAFLNQGLIDHVPETFCRGIVKAAPRSNVSISLDDGTVKESQFWDFSAQSRNGHSDGDVIARFRELLLDSIRIRLRSDVKVGVLVSGGLDSSSIAVACSSTNANVETYSVISDDERFDERRFIRELSRRGVHNQEIVFRSSDVLEELDRVLYHLDEPFGGFSVIAQHKMFAAIRRNTDVTVLLSGQGGDEVLLGYLKFFFFNLSRLVREGRVAAAAREVAGSLVQRTVIRQFKLRKARRYIEALSGKSSYGFQQKHASIPIWRCTDLRQRQIDDIERYSVPVLAHYEDRNSMAHSLEVRHPFLDHRLVDFMVNQKVEMKLHSGWTKYILRKAIPELPDTIRWRRDKQGFLTPEERWLRNELSSEIRSRFTNSKLSQAGFIDDKRFLDYYERYRGGAPVDHGPISRALIAEHWMERTF